jgi:hypothetical protein
MRLVCFCMHSSLLPEVAVVIYSRSVIHRSSSIRHDIQDKHINNILQCLVLPKLVLLSITYVLVHASTVRKQSIQIRGFKNQYYYDLATAKILFPVVLCTGTYLPCTSTLLLLAKADNDIKHSIASIIYTERHTTSYVSYITWILAH